MIKYGDKRGVDKTPQTWLADVAEKLGYRLESRPGWGPFQRTEAYTVHLDIDRLDDAYVNQLLQFFGNEDHVRLTHGALAEQFPDVLVTTSATYERAVGEQKLRFVDVERTHEEHSAGDDKADRLVAVVTDAKARVEETRRILAKLAGDNEALVRQLLAAGTADLADGLATLQKVFSLVSVRLASSPLTISTMPRTTTIGSPKIQGTSHTQWNKKPWILDNSQESQQKWRAWLGGQTDFGAPVAMRLDAAQVVSYHYQNELVHTLVHEVSHAAAATADFGYLDEDKYAKVALPERVGNADTVAQIVVKLTTSTVREAERAAAQPIETVVALILQLAGEIKDDNTLRIRIERTLKDNGQDWDTVEEHADFKKATKAVQLRIGVLML